MSNDDNYGRRASRRVERSPAGPSRASAGSAVAILLTAAVIGFGGGAIVANAGGGGEEPRSSASPNAGSDPGSTPNSPEASPEDSPEPAAGSATLSSAQDGTTVEPGDQIDFAGSIAPPAGEVVLTVQRSLDGGETWEAFGSTEPITTTTTADGSFTTHVFSQREGENHFRLVGSGSDGGAIESNAIVVTIS